MSPNQVTPTDDHDSKDDTEIDVRPDTGHDAEHATEIDVRLDTSHDTEHATPTDDHDSKDDAAPAKPPPAAGASSPKRTPQVLVVDDLEGNLKIVAAFLGKAGYRALTADTAEEGLELARKHKPDLVLLDVLMPEMDGYEMCERLKKDDRIAHIPVIFLTGKRDPKDVVRGFDLGAVDYVGKPFHPAELMARVRTQIKLKLAYDEIQTLRGLLPICARCKSIRDDEGTWKRIEEYLSQHTDVSFSHGICPACARELYPEFYGPDGKLKPRKHAG